jgi:ubiquinone/menaquinone biosynthesis C-methylase UbiE
MSEVWTPDYEMDFWNNAQNYIESLRKKYVYFDVDKKIDKYIACPIEKVMDIGGGEYGGALYYYKGGKERILFDFLANTFSKRGKMGADIKCIQGSFDSLPFDESSISVIFCWEAFDHSQNIEMYKKAQDELVRVLAVGGLVFFECPIRPKPQTGHPVCRTFQEVLEGFHGIKILEQSSGSIADGNRSSCLIFTK